MEATRRVPREPSCVRHARAGSPAWPVALCCLLAWAGGRTVSGAEAAVDYNRHIRPIFSDTCYKCHGPDEKARQTTWRLDVKESAYSEADGGGRLIAPGDPDASVLLQRITSDDPDMRMPPADSKKSLTPEQIDLIRRWIAQGASWHEHWSFLPPKRAQLPAVRDASWCSNEIDCFVLATLDEHGLAPEEPADKEALIRRVTFDLTGLPPSIEEVESFQADGSPDAFERLVDRLLASPRYGEHMARPWLDAARYGDTHGLHLDNYREMYPYRDWVIGAFNRDLPFDQFVTEQVAGDLLPNPTLDQMVATGFNRCNVTTSEGGSIDEEYYVRYAVDRVETFSAVFLGLTMGCAVCHDHKYDPITQKDFYQLYAYYYKSIRDEKAMDGNAKDPPPVMRAPNLVQAEALEELRTRIAAVETRMLAPDPELDEAQAEWEREWAEMLAEQWRVVAPSEVQSTGGATLQVQEDASVLVGGENPGVDDYALTLETSQVGITALRLEVLTDASLVCNGPGRADNGNFVVTEFEAAVSPRDNPQHTRRVRFRYALADHSQEGFGIEKAIDGVLSDDNGWAGEGHRRHESRTAVFVPTDPIGYPEGTRIQVVLRQRSRHPRHTLGRLRLAVSSDPSFAPAQWSPWHMVGPFEAPDGYAAHAEEFPPERGVDLEAAYADGKLTWKPRPDWADGEIHFLEGNRCSTYLYRTIYAPSARTVDVGFGSDDALKVWLNGQLVHQSTAQRITAPDQDKVVLELRPGENRLLVKVTNYDGGYGVYFRMAAERGDDSALRLAPLVRLAASDRTLEQAEMVRKFFRKGFVPQWSQWQREVDALRNQEVELLNQVPTTLVTTERRDRPQAHFLKRGQYDMPAEPVDRNVPDIFPRLPEGAPNDRLGLARWLTDPSHPLMARVTVNRIWQQIFGTGIVRTAEDFGAQGEPPSHGELLDWLAVEFREAGWGVKALQRKILLSSTYRQSSRVTPEKLRRDPENRLLARGPRFRLDAEMVRDNALALAGLLVGDIGGPSVKPYQPEGLWEAVGYTSSNTAKFRQDHGAALYRRSLYTFWKRTSPPPTLTLFDSPSREACTVRRPRTNTPLQALALMNDIQFVEASRMFAQRILREGGSSVEDRLEFAFQSATARLPDREELDVLRGVLEKQLEEYRANAESAAQLLCVGEYPVDPSLDSCELAAWTMLANLILNLSETITKG